MAKYPITRTTKFLHEKWRELCFHLNYRKPRSILSYLRANQSHNIKSLIFLVVRLWKRALSFPFPRAKNHLPLFPHLRKTRAALSFLLRARRPLRRLHAFCGRFTLARPTFLMTADAAACYNNKSKCYAIYWFCNDYIDRSSNVIPQIWR